MFGQQPTFGTTGFGQQQQPQQPQQPSTSLFGQTTTTQPGYGGFGAAPTTSAFGQPATTASAFGQPAQTSSTFGATTSSGFGTTGSSAFGTQSRPFGSTNSLFPGTTTTSTPTSTGFGFGGTTTAAPTFGSTSNTTGSLFGARAPTTSAFGSGTGASVFGTPTSTTSAFGAPPTTAFGATNTIPNGTASTPYSVTNERDQANGSNNAFHSISAMSAYKNYSFEELRLQDYQQGRKTASGTATGFGTNTNVFGTSNTPGGFGQTAPTTGTPLFGGSSSAATFGQTQPTTFGQSGTTGFSSSTGAPGNLFGSSTATGSGLFGSNTQPQQPTAAFGTGNAFGSGGTAFGSNTGFGGQTAKPATFGFGSATATQPTTAFGTTASSSFGSTGTTTTGPFGSTTQPATPFGSANQPTTFGFNQTQASTQPTQTGFGFNTTSQLKPPSLFGTTTTSTTPPFGGMGTQQPQTTKPTFNFTPNTTFASGSQTPGFIGQTSTTAPTPTLFGTQPPNTNFNTVPGVASTFSGNLFGGKTSTAPSTSSVFNITPSAQPTFSFGSQPAPTTTLFPSVQTNFGVSTAQVPQASMVATIDNTPYGNNPLFANVTASVSGAPTQGAPVSILAGAIKKKPAMTPHYKVTPRSASKVKLRGFTSSTSPFNSSNAPNGAGRGLHLFDGVGDDSVLSADSFVPRQSVKKLVIDRRIGEEEILSSIDASGISDSPFVVGNGKGKAPATSSRPRVTFNPNLEVAAAESFYTGSPATTMTYDSTNVTPAKRLDLTATTPDVSILTPSRNGFSSASPVNGDASAEGEYWTSPSYDTLRRLSPEELSHVRDFKVGLTGYGQVSFLVPVDLTGVASLRAIAGSIVILERRACTVYPDETTKPPQGQGLNVPALISLEQCWPIDKATRQPIFNPGHLRFQQHLAKLKRIPETEFVEFQADTGTWVFKVKHFSRYGLDYSDSDDDKYDDDSEIMAEARRRLRRLQEDHTVPDDANDAPPAQSMASLAGKANTSGMFRVPDDSADEWFPSAEEDNAMIIAEDSSVPEDTFRKTNAESRASFKLGKEEDNEEEDVEEEEEDEMGTFGDEEEMEVEGESESFEADESDSENRPPRNLSKLHDAETENELDADLDMDDPNWQPPRHSLAHPEYLGLDARRVQVMQATFFPQEEKRPAILPRLRGIPNAMSTLGKRAQTAVVVQGSDEEAGIDEARSSFVSGPLLHRPTGAVGRPPRKYARIGFSDSLLYNKNNNVVDAGLMMGRSFRVGWGKGGILVHAGKVVGISVASDELSPSKSNAYTGIPSKVYFEKVKIFPDGDEEIQKERHRATLEVQLSQTQIEQDEVGVPYVSIASETGFFSYVSVVTSGPGKNRFHAHETLIWKLGQSLFDGIPTVAEDTLSEPMKHKVQDMNRKAAFTAWLQEAVQPAVQTHLQREMASGNPVGMVFAFLTGRQVAKACQAAIRNRDFKLATLVAQAGGERNFRMEVREQLRKWKEYSFEGAIGKEYRRIYELLSGNFEIASGTSVKMDQSEKNEHFSVSDGLDWKRTVGLYLWYAMFAETPLEEGFKNYEAALHMTEEGADLRVAVPRPWYEEEERHSQDMRSIRYFRNVKDGATDGKQRDILFHIIKLYTDETHGLEQALAPRGITPSPLDYRLTWHLYLLFAKVLKVRDFADRWVVAEDVLDEESSTPEAMVTTQNGWSATADSVTASLAFQLETLGMWEWAVFVLLYLEGAESRAIAIRDIVSRYLPLEPKTEEEVQTERFLVEKLKLPLQWIREAKAQRAQYVDDVHQQTLNLLLAGQHNTAHKIIVERLAPEMILHGDLKGLHDLLEQISHDQAEGWHLGGEVYHDYIGCMLHMPNVWQQARELGAATENLYALRRRMQRLLKSLARMKREGTRIEVSVCVAHMASRVSELLRDASEQVDENDVLTTLPLPEDQRLVRLHEMSHDYFTNLIEQESY